MNPAIKQLKTESLYTIGAIVMLSAIKDYCFLFFMPPFVVLYVIAKVIESRMAKGFDAGLEDGAHVVRYILYVFVVVGTVIAGVVTSNPANHHTKHRGWLSKIAYEIGKNSNKDSKAFKEAHHKLRIKRNEWEKRK